MNLKNIKIGLKLSAGFGIVVLLAVVAMVIGFDGFNNVLVRVDKSEDSRFIVDEILQMRRYEKDYILSKEQKYIDLVHEKVESIIQVATTARAKYSDEANKEEKDQIIQQITAYQSAFDEYLELEKEKTDRMSTMRASGHVVINNLKRLEELETKEYNLNVKSNKAPIYVKNILDAGNITELFLEVRKGEKDVIIFDEEKYLIKLNKNFSLATDLAIELESNNISQSTKELSNELIEKLVLYKSNFDAFYALMQKQNLVSDGMVELADKAIVIAEEAAQRQTEDMFTGITAAKLKLITVSLIAALLGLVIATLITRSITTPLAKGVAFAKHIASGNLSQELNINQKDEIGELANSMKEMANKLRDIVTNITSGSHHIASASNEVSSTSQQLSQGANEQASSVQEVSSTMEEITSNIEQNTENAYLTEKISTKAKSGIEDVKHSSQETINATKDISDKITIINDIAGQTNILALNAAVEAARAGEHGKGFAVVAAEVRKLAERSKIAADEIVALSQNGFKQAQLTGKRMEEILPEVDKTAKLVQEIAAASNEQSNGVNQINTALQQLNNVTQQNAAASEELASGSEEMSGQAMQLQDLISFFKTEE